MNKDPAFRMHLLTHKNNAITSSLSVIAFPGLNGTRIMCTDSTVIGADSQEIIVEVLGKFVAQHGHGACINNKIKELNSV